MTILFYLRYHSQYGQTLYLHYNNDKIEMNFLNERFWVVSLDIDSVGVLEYNYSIKDVNNEIIREWEAIRQIDLSKITAKTIQLIDTWNDADNEANVFFTSAFRNVLLPKASVAMSKMKAWRGNTHVFRVKAPLLKKHEQLCILGSSAELGNWSTIAPMLMYKEGNCWTIKLNFSAESIKNQFPIAYKYGVYNIQSHRFECFEMGENRMVEAVPEKGIVYIYSDGFARLDNNSFKGAGVAIPVFSLRTGNSYGVGEFSDIMLLVDWARKTGLKLIQLLPINDTNATCSNLDSYPYKAISAFALHPIYINLDKIAGKEHKHLIKRWRKTKRALNSSSEVNYEAVLRFKLKSLVTLFELMGSTVFATSDFKNFFELNKHWLEPYAVFCKYRDKFGTANFATWPQLASFDAHVVQRMAAPGSRYFKKLSFQYFIQYWLHRQLEEAVNYARRKSVVLKGDLPIGISKISVDVWKNPEFFHIDQQAGAPPDMFATKGQNWGFPTYNWEKMAEDNYAWWKQRLGMMSRYFDAFRIDHILGFFRIWSIPEDAVEGVLGRFVPALPLTISELQRAGVAFDYQRFCTPYITDALLEQVFHEKAPLVKDLFLERNYAGNYKLLNKYNTQQKIDTYFNNLESRSAWESLRMGLFDIVSNVLLLNSIKQPGKAFHCRINLQDTMSYQALDDDNQLKLQRIYQDYFYRRQESIWKDEALLRLPALKEATNMLVCGEDLGMVPRSVSEVMQRLGILSLEVQRMPKQPTTLFVHLENVSYLSVVTPGTHDMSTIREWWEENSAVTQQFFHDVLGESGPAPVSCEPWINKAIIMQHLKAPAIWAVFQLQDLLGIDAELRRKNPLEERINIPADPQHFWGYRMHLTLEQLIQEQIFNAELLTYIKQSGR